MFQAGFCYTYSVDSFISFLLIVFILILLVAIVIAHIVDGLLRGVSTRATGASPRLKTKRLSELDKQMTELDFMPGAYRDIQLDELLAADRFREAQKIVTERIKQAIEQGDDERIIFYREYQRRIDCGAA